MIDHSISCFETVLWFEPHISPDDFWDEHSYNITRPLESEVRQVCIRHEHQEPTGGRMWLLFQSAYSLANGFPEPAGELENAAIIEVEVLSQTKLPKKKTLWPDAKYRAEVRCLQIVPLTQITQKFSPCKPRMWSGYGAREKHEVQLFQTPSFTQVWIVTQETTEWFLLTRTEPPRLILNYFQLVDEPFEVCNCEWDWAKWPHRVHKARK